MVIMKTITIVFAATLLVGGLIPSFLASAPVSVLAAAPVMEEWSRTYGNTGDENTINGWQTSDGGYMIYASTSGGWWMIKTDAEGNEEWNKPLAFGRGLDWAAPTSDSGSALLSWARGEQDYPWLTKLDAAGNVEWDKKFGLPGYHPQSHQQTFDDGYIIVGETEHCGSEFGDVWLIKIDEEGNEEWDKTFGGSDHDGGHGVHQTSDGGYIITGHTESSGAGGWDVWLTKTDDEGNEEWDKTFGGLDYDCGNIVHESFDGGYIILGHTLSYGGGGRDIWLIKTDDEGNEEWNKTFGGSGDEGSFSVQQTSDGGYILGGWTDSYGAGDLDGWLIKTDNEGNEEWGKTFGGSGKDTVGVQQISDGSYILIGGTDSYGAGGSDVWLIKVRLKVLPTPEGAIEDLITIIEEYNLQHGINKNLKSKLQNALDSLTLVNADQREDAINKLKSFINNCEAQKNKWLTSEQADELITQANAIIELVQQS